MTHANLAILLGVFLGDAAPWLEAIVVIPGGILGGGPPVPVATGIVGNLATVAAAAWFGERIQAWWIKRRSTRRGDDPARIDDRKARRQERVERIMRRWGLPALAALGPVGLGTQLSAIIAVSLGTTARAAFAWIGASTVVWSVIAAVLTATGMSIAGVGL